MKGLEGSIERTPTRWSRPRSGPDEPAPDVMRALADTGGPGEADDPRRPGSRVELGDQLGPRRIAVLDQRNGSRQSALLARDQAFARRSVARSSAADHAHGTGQTIRPGGSCHEPSDYDRPVGAATLTDQRLAPRGGTSGPLTRPGPRRAGPRGALASPPPTKCSTPKYARLAAPLPVAPPAHRRRAGAGAPTACSSSGRACSCRPAAPVRSASAASPGSATARRSAATRGSSRSAPRRVLGQECTISAYQRVAIGQQCVIADRVMFIDFDHDVADPEQPIRKQGIYKRDVVVGSNVWIGYGAQILRGVTIGDNAVIGASSVVTRDIPANAVAAGSPARVVRMRPTPGAPAAGPTRSSPATTGRPARDEARRRGTARPRPARGLRGRRGHRDRR